MKDMTAMRTAAAAAMPMSLDRLKTRALSCSNPVEGCLEIGDQIFDVFETNR